MKSLKEEAQNYEPKKTRNVSELPYLEVDAVIYEGEGIDENGKEFTYKYLKVDGEEYRVPQSVISQIKDLLDENDKLTKFKIIRKGTGRTDTRYTVVPA